MIKFSKVAKISAAAVLAGAMLVSATAAEAYPYWKHNGNWNHNWNHSYGYYGGDDGFVGGLLGGLFAGAVVNSLAQPNYYPDGNSCYRFKTYNPATGMYMSYRGPRHCP